MIEVMIVDDEPAGRRTLREYCAEEPDLALIGEYGDSDSAIAAIRAHPPRLLFLDIQMDPLNGIELARTLPATAAPSIVFVTAYDSYAVEAFEINAVDYLLKPFDQERFRKSLDRVRSEVRASAVGGAPAAVAELLALLERERPLREAERPRILAEFGGRLHVLDAAQVEMVESDRNYISIRVGRDSFHARSTLQQAEVALGSQPMLRISRSCLVNMNFVREVNRTLRGDFILVLAGGATVTSSEGFRPKVKEYLQGLRLGDSQPLDR